MTSRLVVSSDDVSVLDSGPADLAGLFMRLRDAGFRVDTRQYLSAAQLILALARNGIDTANDTTALVRHLGPIFCTSPDEQQIFARLFQAERRRETPAAPAPPATPASRPRIAARVALALLVASPIILSAWAVYWYRRIEHTVTVMTATASGNTAPAPAARVTVGDRVLRGDGQGHFRFEYARVDGTQRVETTLAGWQAATVELTLASARDVAVVLVPAPAPVVDQKAPSEDEASLGPPRVTFTPALPQAAPAIRRTTPWGRIALWSGGVAAASLLAWLAGALLWRHRRRLALQRLAGEDGAEFARLPGEVNAADLFADTRLRRTTAALRRARFDAVADFDVHGSIEAAVASGGMALPRFTPRRAIPEYVALVERLGADDHQARLYDELLARLESLGLAVDRYDFAGDPRACFVRGAPGRTRPLSEVLSTHHRAAVLLFTDAQRCFNPLSGAPLPWLDALDLVARRALLTATPPYHWGWAEDELAARGFFVTAAVEEGLTAFGERVAETVGPEASAGRESTHYARPFPRVLASQPWLANDRVAPPPLTVTRLVSELRGYLAPRAFAWLAACAVYPEISWSLTLHLAATIWPDVGGTTPVEEVRAQLASLARLPWFRTGTMPEWLRATLLHQLTESQERDVRGSLSGRLETLVQQALRRADRGDDSASGLRIGAWASTLDFARSRDTDSPLRDAVFLGYLQGKQPPPTAMAAPPALRRFFARLGVLPDLPGLQVAPRSWRHTWATALRSSLLARPTAGAVASALLAALGTGTALRHTLVREERGAAPPPTAFELAFTPGGWITTYGDTLQVWDKNGTNQSTIKILWGARRLRVRTGFVGESFSSHVYLTEVIGDWVSVTSGTPVTEGVSWAKPRALARLARNRVELVLYRQGKVAGMVSLLRGLDPSRIDVAPDEGFALVADNLLTKVELDSLATEIVLPSMRLPDGCRFNSSANAFAVWAPQGYDVYTLAENKATPSFGRLTASGEPRTLLMTVDGAGRRAALSSRRDDGRSAVTLVGPDIPPSQVAESNAPLRGFISDDGRELAVFDGARVSVYPVEDKTTRKFATAAPSLFGLDFGMDFDLDPARLQQRARKPQVKSQSDSASGLSRIATDQDTAARAPLPTRKEAARSSVREGVTSDAPPPVVSTRAVTGVGTPLTAQAAAPPGPNGSASQTAPSIPEGRPSTYRDGVTIRVWAELIQPRGTMKAPQAQAAQTAALELVEKCVSDVGPRPPATGSVALTVFAPDVPSSAPTGQSDFDLAPSAKPMTAPPIVPPPAPPAYQFGDAKVDGIPSEQANGVVRCISSRAPEGKSRSQWLQLVVRFEVRG